MFAKQQLGQQDQSGQHRRLPGGLQHPFKDLATECAKPIHVSFSFSRRIRRSSWISSLDKSAFLTRCRIVAEGARPRTRSRNDSLSQCTHSSLETRGV